MNITGKQINQVFPLCKNPDGWAQALTPAFAKYGIDSTMRIASFMAQVGHESGQMNRLIEGLTYTTAARLVKIWPKRFPTEAAAVPYVNNPLKLANMVYAGRMGNGATSSGDGFKFRGRGLIQITGRNNYKAVSDALSIDAIGNPDLLTDPNHAAMSAAWYWSTRGLNELADDKTGDDDWEDFATITQRINGAKTGLQERFALYNKIAPLLV